LLEFTLAVVDGTIMADVVVAASVVMVVGIVVGGIRMLL
jgi:hypothetical protein